MQWIKFVIIFLLFSLIGQNVCHAEYPSEIQELMNTIKKEAYSYTERKMDTELLEKDLMQGNFSKAKSRAEQIIQKQRSNKIMDIRHNLPPGLQQLIDTIEREFIGYKNRHVDIDLLKKQAIDGDYSKARTQAENIIKKQRRIRDSKN